jgi:hypothetical protein
MANRGLSRPPETSVRHSPKHAASNLPKNGRFLGFLEIFDATPAGVLVQKRDRDLSVNPDSAMLYCDF